MTAYAKPAPYRKAQTYQGAEMVPGASVPSSAATPQLPWNALQLGDATWSSPWNRAQIRDKTVRAAWDAIAAHDRDVALPIHQLAAHDRGLALPWDRLPAHQRNTAVPFRQLRPHDLVRSLRWDGIDAHQRNATVPFRQLRPHDRTAALPWKQLAARSLEVSALWRQLAARNALVALPWGPSGAYNGGIGIPWPVDPPPGEGPITVPILPVYVMIPSISATRVSDGAALPILGVDLQLDIDSWAWTFSAPMSYKAKALVDPAGFADPVEIEIQVNGYAWRMLVESYSDHRKFGSNTLEIRGRSPSALLAAPFAPKRTYTQSGSDLLASQLAGNELDGSGWTLVWDAVDWLLPDGTFTYADLAPIEAISRLADAVGATVFSAPVDRELRVAPTYADSPWAWDTATPYAILPANILASGDGSWSGGTNANGVFVRSENDSVAALVRITGTDGSAQLPMVVDRLLVTADAVRERGRSDIAGAGVIKQETRTIPLFPSPADPGLILPGKLLEIHDTDETWRGMVRSVRITAQKSGGANSVRQILGMERQFR